MDNTAGLGGGILNNNSLNLTNSTLRGNSVGNRGGVYNFATIQITSSTLSGNSPLATRAILPHIRIRIVSPVLQPATYNCSKEVAGFNSRKALFR